MSLDIKANKNKDSLDVFLKGEIDINTIEDFKNTLYKEIDNEVCNIKLYCDNLEYIDSLGLGVLVSLLKRVKDNNCKIHVCNLKNNVKKLFLLTNLDKVFIIE